VFDLDLASASETKFKEAVKWLSRKQAETREAYGFFIPAADVEAVQMVATGDVQDFESLLTTIQLGDDELRLLFHPGPDAPRILKMEKVKGVQLPVLFMYGGIGWQLHLRVTIEQQEDRETGCKCAVFPRRNPLPYLNDILTIMESAVGVGIEKDYQEFFAVLRVLHGWESHGLPPKPFELSRLTLLSGCAITWSSLLRMVYTFLGGYLCKDWRASAGDQLWETPYASLPRGLKCYLHGDIQQPAIVAWVAVTVWVSHLFPDITLVTRINHMTARQLLAWWVERVIKNTTAAGWANTTPTTAYNRQGAIDRAGVPRDNPEFDVVRTCPDWPAITTGGCRELHLPGVLFHAIYDSLRRVEAGCAVRVWPGLGQLQLRHNLTLGVDPQQLPSPSNEAQPKPGLRVPISLRSDFFDLPPERLSFEAIKERAVQLKITARQVLFLYMKEDADRAVRTLESWEADPTIARNLLGTDRIRSVIWDLREFLQSIGRLKATPVGWVDPYNYGLYMVRMNRIRQGTATLPPVETSAITASFAPSLINLGPLPPLPPGEAQKARSRITRKRRAREHLRLEKLGLREPKCSRTDTPSLRGVSFPLQFSDPPGTISRAIQTVRVPAPPIAPGTSSMPTMDRELETFQGKSKGHIF
jgi:hypothetical protein